MVNVPPFLPWAGSFRFSVALPAKSFSVMLASLEPGLAGDAWLPESLVVASSPPPPQAPSVSTAARAARASKVFQRDLDMTFVLSVICGYCHHLRRGSS